MGALDRTNLEIIDFKPGGFSEKLFENFPKEERLSFRGVRGSQGSRTRANPQTEEEKQHLRLGVAVEGALTPPIRAHTCA